MSRPNNATLTIFATLLIILLISCFVLLNLTPPISRDALVHHLALPKRYIEHGSMLEFPELVFSYYPQNLDLLYLGALYFFNDIVPKFIHLGFGLATALLIYRYLTRNLTKVYGLTGAAFFLSVPIIVKLSTTVYVDLGLTFFSSAALLAIFKWAEDSSRSSYLVLAGICCGLALGTKYNALLVLFILLLFIPFLYRRAPSVRTRSSWGVLKALFIFGFCALLIASPWFIRNFWWTGNPIYPLFDSLFNPGSGIAAEGSRSSGIMNTLALRHVLYGETVWQLLALPVRIFFEGTDGDPRYFDGRLNPFLLLLPPFVILGARAYPPRCRIEIWTLLAFILLYFLLAINSGPLRIRYLVPILPWLVVLSMFGLHTIVRFTEKTALNRFLTPAAAALITLSMFGYNGHYLARQLQATAPLDYLLGRESRIDFLARNIPEFALVEYANNNLGNRDTLLMVFMGNRGYYVDIEHIFDDHTTPDLLVSGLIEVGVSGDHIASRLHSRGVTTLMLRTDLLEHWLRNTNNEALQRWYSFRNKHLTPLAKHLTFELYKLNP